MYFLYKQVLFRINRIDKTKRKINFHISSKLNVMKIDQQRGQVLFSFKSYQKKIAP